MPLISFFKFIFANYKIKEWTCIPALANCNAILFKKRTNVSLFNPPQLKVCKDQNDKR